MTSGGFSFSGDVAIWSVSSERTGSSIIASVESEISILIRICPVFTSSPAATAISVTVPLTSAGISIEALSDSKTRMVSSAVMVSPGATATSLTSAPSIPSPKSGRSISLIIFFLKPLWGSVFPGLNYISSLLRPLWTYPVFHLTQGLEWQ